MRELHPELGYIGTPSFARGFLVFVVCGLIAGASAITIFRAEPDLSANTASMHPRLATIVNTASMHPRRATIAIVKSINPQDMRGSGNCLGTQITVGG